MRQAGKKAKVQISDLKLRTIIGTNAWERHTKQEIVINVIMEFDAAKAISIDALKETVDY